MKVPLPDHDVPMIASSATVRPRRRKPLHFLPLLFVVFTQSVVLFDVAPVLNHLLFHVCEGFPHRLEHFINLLVVVPVPIIPAFCMFVPIPAFIYTSQQSHLHFGCVAVCSLSVLNHFLPPLRICDRTPCIRING